MDSGEAHPRCGDGCGEDRERLGTAQWLQAAPGRASLISGLGGIYPACFISGRVVTCQCEPGDNLALHVALTLAPEHSVIVCAAADDTNVAFFGALMGLDARNSGIVGLVIDARVRDVEELERMEFPVFCAGTSPGQPKKEHAGAYGVPVKLRGVTINPDDYLIADRDGIVVVPSTIWEEIQGKAYEIAAAEGSIRERLNRGERLFDVLDLTRRVSQSRGGDLGSDERKR